LYWMKCFYFQLWTHVCLIHVETMGRVYRQTVATLVTILRVIVQAIVQQVTPIIIQSVSSCIMIRRVIASSNIFIYSSKCPLNLKVIVLLRLLCILFLPYCQYLCTEMRLTLLKYVSRNTAVLYEFEKDVFNS
jgi:hypothetical protein